jgi:hypothetical protein
MACPDKTIASHPPFFENADLLIAADCVPFAYADFHEDMLKGKALAVDAPNLTRQLLTEIN